MIVSRSYTTPRLQRDGRRLVTMIFIDSGGDEYQVKRWLGPGDDPAAMLLQAEADVVAKLAEYELEAIVQEIRDGLLLRRQASGQPLVDIATSWAAPAQVRAHLFRWFSTARADDARHLVPAIAALTDADLMTMLGIDQAGVDAIRTRAALLSQINDLTVAADG